MFVSYIPIKNTSDPIGGGIFNGIQLSMLILPISVVSRRTERDPAIIHKRWVLVVIAVTQYFWEYYRQMIINIGSFSGVTGQQIN